MAPIRRLVLDVLKPHDPSVVTFTTQLGDLDGIDAATATVVEVDENVKTLRVTLEGDDLDLEAVRAEIEDLSASVHSVDQVACGSRTVDDPWFGS
ncbi:DUF211 domain-containing protein [Natronorubrum bangense]|uniref:DUF211 domain-containing protein n=2 Tax=Natronorubrum bangense TaxID=61858 RepID=L9WKV0_9EURY|nr:DUF211 domain-containing protein [Natronorubrum bangense]ELY50120.1 hypothetical protein C494_06168 [Natronorubrum bangense JCM 10635]QCC54199.1 hypothetical protein DV706_06665 [Natronorubrum bangense]